MVVAIVILTVIAAGVEPAVAVGQTAAAGLCGVVIDNVEQDFDAVAVQFTNCGLHLVENCLRPRFDRADTGITVVRGKEVD